MVSGQYSWGCLWFFGILQIVLRAFRAWRRQVCWMNRLNTPHGKYSPRFGYTILPAKTLNNKAQYGWSFHHTFFVFVFICDVIFVCLSIRIIYPRLLCKNHPSNAEGMKCNLIIFFVLYAYGTFAFMLYIGRREASEVCSLKYFWSTRCMNSSIRKRKGLTS